MENLTVFLNGGAHFFKESRPNYTTVHFETRLLQLAKDLIEIGVKVDL